MTASARPADSPAHLRGALTSPSGKVVALALKLGATVPAFLTRDTLANAFIAGHPLTRWRILDATRQLNRWDALDCLIDAIGRDSLAPDVLRALTAWQREISNRYARLSTAPSSGHP